MPTVAMTTAIDTKLQRSLVAYCKRKGLKIQSVIEQAIRDQLEDELDVLTHHQRFDESEVPLETVLKKMKKK